MSAAYVRLQAVLLLSSSRTAPLLTEIERAASRTAVLDRAVGRQQAALDHRRRADVQRPLAQRARPRPAGAGPARARPRIRVGRARGRRHRRPARPAPQLAAAAASTAAQRARLMLAAARACGIVRPPPIPAAELRPRGRRHSRERDARAVRHHYDLSNDFFALFLDESMTYSCALFSRGATTLEEAQEAKLELVCDEARARAGPARARHRLRLGQLRDPRGAQPRRRGHRHHPLGAAGRAGAPARRGGRCGRQGRHPRHGLPRPVGRALRRGREHRHGRARRQRRRSTPTRSRSRVWCARAGAC